MGDRGNIVVVNRGKRIYLYTHWRGSDIVNIAKRALGRHQRWSDPAYLTRIIFCEMIDGDVKGETGYGISTELGDNSHPILVVDCDKQEVYFEKGDGPGGSFEKFIS